jgi:large subunit ribosomal protein L18
MISKRMHRITRHKRIRKNVHGTKSVPRLTVFRSNKHVYAQLIDDSTSTTIAASSDIKMKVQKDKIKGLTIKIENASEVGTNLAKIAQTKKIKKVVFDRSGYKYHGRIKALAESARKGGLDF